MKKVVFAAAVLALTTLQSCSEHDDPIQQGTSIEFRTLMDKTKASLLLGADDVRFNSFMVKASKEGVKGFEFMPGTPVFKEGTDWTYAPTKFYPTDGKAVNFFAYAPINDGNLSKMTNTGKVTTFEYIVPADQSKANTSADLLVARAQKSSGDVALTFQHALSAVTFSAKNLNEAGELTYIITKLEIAQLLHKGKFTYNTGDDAAVGTWTPTTAVSYLPAVVSSGVAVEPKADFKQILSDNDWMMVMPQEPTWATIDDITKKPAGKNSYIAVTFNVRDGAGQDVYKDKVFYLVPASDFKFEAGKRYRFQIAFAKLNGINFTATLTGWADTTDTPVATAGLGLNNFNYNNMFGN